eukprot:364606-Chlamydomonas_euryale.AAC.1
MSCAARREDSRLWLSRRRGSSLGLWHPAGTEGGRDLAWHVWEGRLLRERRQKGHACAREAAAG